MTVDELKFILNNQIGISKDGLRLIMRAWQIKNLSHQGSDRRSLDYVDLICSP